ncbi:MAG: restriction endonuclease subunit S [Gammaproteobacteria bacterium]|nr:restriction endonuclease subunit S [Gammaproteobacteria bacterium]
MIVNQSVSVVPKLRFPRFQSAGDWKADQLDNVAKITKGKGVSKADITEGGETPCIRYAELYTQYREVIHDVVSRTNVPHEDLVLSQAEDVIVPASGETREDIARAACVLSEQVALGSDLNILRSNLHGPFFSYLLNSPLRHKIARMAQGDTVAHLYPKQLSQVRLAYPSYPEQQNIADCLASLDNLIAAEDRKLEALRQHKQGLMQQLFPQPSETVPPLGVQSDWKTLSLPKVVFFQEGPGIMAADFHSTGIPLVRLSGLAEKCVTLDGCNFLDPHKVAQKWAHFRLAVDDLVISTSASFGRVSIATEAVAGAVFYTGLVRFRSTDKRLSNAYLKSFLESPNFLRQVESYAVGGGIKHFGPTHLRQMHIQLPPLFEQQRIADCLGSLDGLVSAMCRRLIFLRQHKQGLMQRLFPSLEGE